MFASFYTYGHLLTIAFSVCMALAWLLAALRLPGARRDLWTAVVYSVCALAGAAEMWLAMGPSLMRARVYFSVIALVYWMVTIAFHLQYAVDVLPPRRLRGYRVALGLFTALAVAMQVMLHAGLLDGGEARTVELWGARSMLIAARPWSFALMAVYALANFPLCVELLHRQGPRRAERRLVSIPMWTAPLLVVWELSITIGWNPYLPLGGYFAALLGLQGAVILIERVSSLHEPKVGGYVIDSRLGHGGMAEVFLAHKQGSGELSGVIQKVALKRMRLEHASNPSFVQMFLDEAKLVARLSHPNIVKLLDAGREGEQLYLAMELIEGATLSQVLRVVRAQQARLSAAAVVEVAMQVCDALEYAHALKSDDGRSLDLVHRDVSPQNILIDDAAHVKLTDFGIARSIDRGGETQTGMLKGKLSYMAPEQIRGQYDHRADLYALGIVMFEMITGQKPHDTTSEATLLYQILEGQLPRLSLLDESPPALAEAARAALDVDPARRPRHAAALRDRLVKLRDESRARTELSRWVYVTAELLRQKGAQALEHDTVVEGGPDAPTRV